MACKMHRLLERLLYILLCFHNCRGEKCSNTFPDNFTFGAASSAYQTEGGWLEDGKGESIWDRLTSTQSDSVLDEANGRITADSYHKYKEDVILLHQLGVNYYRFSIAWTRIMPTGDKSSLNQKGIEYYDKLIDLLLLNGIKPMVTIYHWDLPQALQELGGWTNSVIIEYIVAYADVLFQSFGNRVDKWITINEPFQICEFGYGNGTFAPAVKSPGLGSYMCMHNVLLANARIYDLFQLKYKANYPKTKLGYSTYCSKYYPFDTNREEDRAASRRVQQFMCGMYLHPIFSKKGGYPTIVQNIVRKKSKAENRSWSRLPHMDKKTRDLIRGKSDFLGLNYYSANYTIGRQPSSLPILSLYDEMFMEFQSNDSWPQSEAIWQRSYPIGLRDILMWIRVEYNNPEVIITENGWAEKEIVDVGRVSYLRSHLQAVLDAMCDGSQISGYVYWSLTDNFEWSDGFRLKYGLYHVNFSHPKRPRWPRLSASVYRDVIRTRRIDSLNIV